MAKIGIAFAAATVAALSMGTTGRAQDAAEVMHSWTSEGEAAAIAKFADAFNAAGGKWIDIATAGGNNSRSAAVARIIAGSPPDAAQFNTSTQFYDLVSSGKLNSLQSYAAKGNWEKVIPEALLNVAKRDGKIYALPVNMSGVNFVFYSNKVLADAGISRPPVDWDGMLAAMETLKGKGLVPLAVGGDGYIGLVFYSILADYLGTEHYNRLFTKRDPTVDEAGILKTFQTFAKLRDYTDSNWSGRSWNQATQMLINGQAGFQVVGDWAKAEFISNKLTAGKEYGCMLPKGTVIMGGDVIIFPKKGDAISPAQDKLIQAFADVKAQTEFSLLKGSIPARTDVNPADFDVCSQAALKAASSPETRLPRPRMVIPSDVEGEIEDMLVEFFGSTMSPEEGAEQFSDLLQ
ncbi:ABC transporter substrate-binding protein (plasmid) [Agrobacterium vitis]|uniref:ABC transporter substrate-binding protein n=1 Tax=Agrobacterium vitis TaxID=373 RepID=UPI003D2AEE19